MNLLILMTVLKDLVSVSETNEDCNDSKDIFLKADEQLYKAKQNGRNKVCS